MGTIYKLKPDVIEFIVERKKAEPILSCRQIVALVEKKFQFKVSKSSINEILKEAGLSLPIGRRRAKPRLPQEQPMIGEIKKALVSAAESLKMLEPPLVEVPPEKPPVLPVPSPSGAPKPIALPPQPEPEKPAKEIVAQPQEPPQPVVPQPHELLIEKPVEIPVEIKAELPKASECTGAILLKAADYLLFGLQSQASSIFEAQIGQKISLDIDSYPDSLQSISKLNLRGLIAGLTHEVRGIKLTSSDGNSLYLDGQMFTIWSTPHIPFDFNASIAIAKHYIDKYLTGTAPFVLAMSPGFDTPSKDFFKFILGLERGNLFSALTLSGNKLEDLETMPLAQEKRNVIFGLWPWQFAGYRKVIKIGEYAPFKFAGLKKDLYLARIELELTQPNVRQIFALSGFAVKTSLSEKIRIVILSNFSAEETNIEKVAIPYLEHWPNFEESFHDYSRKIELFTYTAASSRNFLTDILYLTRNIPAEQKNLFSIYLQALDLYVKWHILPAGFENKDFSTIKEQFYDLQATLKRENNHAAVTFQAPPEYRLQKELAYICCRLNEREILLSDGKRLWFLPG